MYYNLTGSWSKPSARAAPFICKYLFRQPLRKKINAQLNNGEQLHGLRVYLWFGGDGVIRKRQEQEQQVTARSLNLLTNIVIVWNTVYIQEVGLNYSNVQFSPRVS